MNIAKYTVEAAKAWVGGVGAAVTAYVGVWTDDPRWLGITALISAVAVYLTPNAEPKG